MASLAQALRPLTRRTAAALHGCVAKNVLSPYSQGRQPCSAFQEDRLNQARTCPQCTAMVQWCGACGQTHHAGGWQTCPGKKTEGRESMLRR